MFIRHIAICILLLLSNSLYMQAQQTYGKGEVKSLLLGKGIDVVEEDINILYDTPEIVVATGYRTKFFAVLANKSYAANVESPVLAYGTDENITSINSTFYSLLECYRRCLTKSYAANDTKGYTNHAESVKPLMDGIKWGQGAPYNSLFPIMDKGADGNRAVTGCGPVAVGQILKYYHHPAALDSAKLLYNLASDMHADLGNVNTSSSSNTFRPILMESYNFSPRCVMLKISCIEDLDLVYSEVNAGRPVILSGFGHFFICDGVDGNYLHFNFGWEGVCDGYYTSPYSLSLKAREVLFDHIMIGLEPDMHNGMYKYVKVKSAGSLAQILTEQEKCEVHSLKIKGKLNGEDLRLLRRMAGAVDDHDYKSWRGSLQYLDLSQARIMDDWENPYYSVDAAKIRFSIWKELSFMKNGLPAGVKRYEYRFDNITEAQWEELKGMEMDRGEDYVLVKRGDSYFVNYFPLKRTIGTFMFVDCINLKWLKIPEDTQSIGSYAFQNTSLETYPQVAN